MARNFETITQQLYASHPDGKLYPEISDKQIARELFEAGEPISATLRRALSPPLMRFFARVEHGLTYDPAFRENVEKALLRPPSYLMPYTGRLDFLENELPGGAKLTLQDVIDHDASVQGHHFTSGHNGHLAAHTFANHSFFKEEPLAPSLLQLHKEAHFAQHSRDGYCMAGGQAQQFSHDAHTKVVKALNHAERPMLEHCLTYSYPAYRIAPTFSDFSLNRAIKLPVTDTNDMDDLEFADRTIRSTAFLLQLLLQDETFKSEIDELLQDEEVAAHIARHTQRGHDKNKGEPHFLRDAIIRTVEEGIGSSVLPAIGELRRPTADGNQMEMAEIVAKRSVTQLTTLSPLSYIGKTNIRGRGLPSVSEQNERGLWGFTDEAKICLRAMRTFLRRQFHYGKLKNNRHIQTGGRCPFALEDANLPTDIIAAATELIFLLSTHVTYSQPWNEYGDGMKHYLQQRGPGPFYEPGVMPDLSQLSEKITGIDAPRYQRLGLVMAQTALTRNTAY